ncbi:MAG: DNRLRE domain-containing protein, partial [Planctomycetes bacterium]|nr:DNRLRE domain-containing protein [Planctomycetota bacterium]
ESVPLASAVSVKQDDSKITTGDLITGNPTAAGGMAEFYRTFLDFDISGVSTTASQLTSAVLRIYQTEVYETQGADSINGGADLFSLDADWDPVTGTFNGLGNSTQIGGTSVWDPDGIELYRDIDVTAAVLAWLADPSSNFGFSLISDLEGTSILSAKYIGGTYNITPPQLILTATQQAGDFDGDGDVDGFDFLTWQRGNLSPSDLADWEAKLTGAALASAASVPEPSTWMLAVVLFPVLMVRHRLVLVTAKI